MSRESVKVTTAFPGVPDNETAVRTIAVGEVITGDLARVAREQGWGAPVGGPAADNVLDLSELTVVELKAHAAERGIDLGDASKKADIIAAIELANKQQGIGVP